MALTQHRVGSMFVFILSVLGTSTPSFLLAMFLWIINVRVHNRFGTSALPPTGFGWDAHLIMPALVLAARPLAQIAQVTYVQVSQTLSEDFIRTARAKGSPRGWCEIVMLFPMSWCPFSPRSEHRCDSHSQACPWLSTSSSGPGSAS
jgi:ABC-type dipeptide/oligopeptide/nickel transport system permease component